jgi:replicative DNA helicase
VINAEKAVLGSCLVGDEKALLPALSVLQPEYFDLAAHRVIYETILQLHRANKPVDTITVAEHLKNGNRAYVFDLTRQVPAVLHVEHYAKIVRRSYFQRQFAAAARRAIETPDDTKQLADLRQSLLSLESDGQTVRQWSEILRSYIDVTLNDRALRQVRVYRSGFPNIDKAVMATPGMLIAVGARPKQGKTSLLLKMARMYLNKGHRVLFLSAEMTGEELLDRLVAMETGIDLWRIRSERVSIHMTQITDACAKLHALPLMMREGGGLNLNVIESAVESFQPDIVFLDFLQRLTPPARVDSRAAYYSDVANGLKSLAMARKVLIIMASQLNRELEKRSDKRPTLADLKESGGIEEAADAVLLLHRTADNDDYWDVDVQVEANRNGPCVTVPFVFFKRTTRFEEKA